MKKRPSITLLTVLLAMVFAAGIGVYSSYIGMKIYQESSDHLLESFSQISETFTLFVQRNWTVLSQWDGLLKNADIDHADSIGADMQANKESWHYSDFYLFNESTQYLTVEGRKGSADSIDGESLLAGNESPRRRAEMQEKYFVYLTSELAARIAELNAPESKEKPLIWCVGVDTGAYQAVQCRLRRPRTFAGAMGLSGLYDMGRFLGSAEDDLVLRSSPLAALHKNGICDKNVLSKAEENSLLLCVGQGGYEGDALADTQALADTLSEVGFPCHLEVWGGDVSHDWYWWGKEFGMFAERLFG